MALKTNLSHPLRMRPGGAPGRPCPDNALRGRGDSAGYAHPRGLLARGALRRHPGGLRSGRTRLEWIGLFVLGIIASLPLLGGVGEVPIAPVDASFGALMPALSSDAGGAASASARPDAGAEDTREAIATLARRFMLAGLPGLALVIQSGSVSGAGLFDFAGGGVKTSPAPSVPPRRFDPVRRAAAESPTGPSHPSRAPPARGSRPDSTRA